MKTKVLAILIITILSANMVYSQQMIIHLKSGKNVKYNLKDIRKITYSDIKEKKRKRKKFIITKNKYDINEVEKGVLSEFGKKYRVADWNDILLYKNDIQSFVKSIGGMEGAYKNLLVTNNGKHFYYGSRHYFISFHNHNKPSSYLAHANIDNYYLSLGSWTGSRYVLCIKK